MISLLKYAAAAEFLFSAAIILNMPWVGVFIVFYINLTSFLIHMPLALTKQSG